MERDRQVKVRGRPLSSSNMQFPEELLKALGRFTIEWARLEFLIRGLEKDLAATMELPSPALFSHRLKKLRELAGDPGRAELSGILDTAATFATRRNELLHGLWCLADMDGHVVLVADGASGRTGTLVHLEELHRVIDDVIVLATEIDLLRSKPKPTVVIGFDSA